jgi:CRP-like cAMP-binding protein
MTRSDNWLSSQSSDLAVPLNADSLLSPELGTELKKRSTVYIPRAGGVLFEEGDCATSIYLLGKGEVNLAIRYLKRTVSCFRIGRGSVIGLSAIVGRKAYTMTALASEDAEIREVDAETFQMLIEGRPQLYLNVLQILAEETLSVYKALAATTSNR